MARYGNTEGLCLSANASVAANTTQDVSGSANVIDISSDVDILAVDPQFTASATDAGIVAEFRFVGSMTESGSYDTNPIIVRSLLNSAGYNQGPRDLLPVVGYKRLKLMEVRNNSTTKTLSGVNVRYRQILANH